MAAIRTAVFAGSFNPFTIGHGDIVKRGLALFDKIIICVGINANKPEEAVQARSRAEHIATLYGREPRVEVVEWDGITALFAKEHGAASLLRSVRSVKDYEYERDMADANKSLYGVETVILFADPSLAYISSSLVRELERYGEDVSGLIQGN